MSFKGRSSQPGRSKSELIIYLRSLSYAFIAISIIVIIQLGFVLKTFEYYYLIVPFILAITLGLLFGHVSVLRTRLVQSNYLFRAVADFAQEFTYFRRLDGHYEYVSPSCITLTGYSSNEFYSTPNLMDKLIHPDDLERWSTHIHSINNQGQPESFDLRLITKNNETVWFNHTCGPVYNLSGSQIGVRSTNLDVSERKNVEQCIEHMAYYDSLTDLPNRRSLSAHIDKLTKPTNTSSNHFAVLFLDLDRFKNINDSFHHEFGDHLLIELAKRLQNFCKSSSYVCRFGGDEFIIVIPYITKPEAAIQYASKIIDLIEQPFSINSKELYISGGIGIALYPYDGQDATTLIRNADAAMYKAKRDNQSHISLYSKQLIENSTTFVTTETQIRQGLTNGEFITYFQPKVIINNKNIVGAEALARWKNPDGNILMPDKFIYIAEETGLIISLGRHILEEVCKCINNWKTIGIEIPVSINISAKQFAHPEFINTTRDLINQYNIDTKLIEFEVTEQVLLNNINNAIDVLLKLKDLGISIAIDDFGTGYSSLNYIKHLPVDTIKIDKSFTNDILTDSRDLAILRAILSLCKDLDFNTIVEGVENEEQARALSQLGYSQAQGFLYYKPITFEALTKLLYPK